MNVGAKNDAGSSAWDQLASSPNHEHPVRQQQAAQAPPQPQPIPPPLPPVVKQPAAAPTDAKPPEYGEELHPELVRIK